MGLTGVILEATFRCPPIETSRLLVDTDRAADLDAVMALMERGDDAYDYSVAWIDLIARGRAMGRSVLTRGRFAQRDEVGGSDEAAVGLRPRRAGRRLHRSSPSGLLNRLSVRAFNEFWFRKAPALPARRAADHPARSSTRSTWSDGWNRIYGPRGFLQWQYVVPLDAVETVRHTVERLSASGCTSFLAVLKRFGPGNAGPLSFPIPGWTLALDIPVGMAGLGPLLDELDDRVVAAGGRIYLAKDSRVRPELLAAMYPRLDEWRAVRERLDPRPAPPERPGPPPRPLIPRLLASLSDLSRSLRDRSRWAARGSAQTLDPVPAGVDLRRQLLAVAVVVDHEVGPARGVPGGTPGGRCGRGRRPRRSPAARPGG